MYRIIALVTVLAGVVGGLALGAAMRADGAAGAVPGAGGAAAGAAGRTGEAAGAVPGMTPAGGTAAGAEPAGERSYVKLDRQIVIPVVRDRRTEALMLFELALDVPDGLTERAYAIQPRLRDAFLRTLLEMSYTGAFSGDYTDERVVRELRDKLRRTAEHLLGGPVHDILVLDMLRQEL